MKAWIATRTGAIVGPRTLRSGSDSRSATGSPLSGTIWSKKDGSRVWEFDVVGIYDGKEKGY